jgi:hypothetical protein
MHFKDDPAIIAAPLPPSTPVTAPAGSSALVKRLGATYNRIGGLLTILSNNVGIPVEAVLAVWQVESAGAAFVPGQAILRFENHKFFQRWGVHNASTFDAHFQFGGRAGVPGAGKPWTNHKWRQGSGAWQVFHGDQTKEYTVFNFAISLSSNDDASWSSSFGGPQILGSNFSILGYATPGALGQAFQQSERWHVCGFFDFCAGSNLIPRIKAKNWVAFAGGYNGAGQAATYGQLIKDAFTAAGQLNL